MRRDVRAVVVALALAAAGLVAGPSRAGHMSAAYTREGGMNAVLLKGEVYTYRDLVARRAENPKRFDRNHPRLGYGLSFGLDRLLARQEINPRRFRHWHPILWWLIQDTTPGDGLSGGVTGKPDPGLPPLVGPLPPPVEPTGPSLSVAVPEPSSLLMGGLGLAAAGGAAMLRVCRRRKG
jgi:MYXO-CTERM domain-containing protein